MSQSRGPDSTASGFFAITPHDTDPLERPTRAIYVGTGGDVKAKNDAGDWVTFVGVPTGATLLIRTQYVHTDSDADDMVALV